MQVLAEILALERKIEQTELAIALHSNYYLGLEDVRINDMAQSIFENESMIDELDDFLSNLKDVRQSLLNIVFESPHSADTAAREYLIH